MLSGAKHSSNIIAVLVLGAALLSSCDTKKEVMEDLQIKDLPSMSARNFETIYTDSGKVTMIVRSPLFNQFSRVKEPYTEFPEGIEVLFYDGTNIPQASVTSRFARYTEKQKLWELRDSVVAVSENGDILETELLFWDQEKDKIYSDRFVQITGKDRILRGTGFESDSRMVNKKIKKLSGEFYIDEQKDTTSGN